jgi:hypothetical protein
MPDLVTVRARRGSWFAAAAVLVTAPRLVIAFLAADGVALPPAMRTTLLCTSSVATAICLTGGSAYLAQAIAAARGAGRLLPVLWLVILVASSALMAPVLAAGLAASPLAAVLSGPAERWGWAICAVLAVDLVAAAVMRADAVARRQHEERDAAHEREIAELIEQRDRARELAARPTETTAGSAHVDAASPPAGPSRGNARSTPLPRPRAARPVSSTSSGRSAPGGPTTCACGRSFASQKSYAGHRSRCKAAAPAPSVPEV